MTRAQEGGEVSVAEIKLRGGQVALVDSGDFERISAVGWSLCSRGYAVRRPMRGGKRRLVSMHIEVLGAAPGMLIDHINGNTLDNRRANLRHVTHSGNSINRRAHSASGYKGVAFNRRARGPRKWQAQLRGAGRNRYLGVFLTAEDAARAYDAAARAAYGDLARLNFPSEVR